MPSQVKHLTDLPVIEIVYFGLVTPADLSASIADALKLVEQGRLIRILTDCSRMEDGHSIVDLLENMMQLVAEDLILNLREAVITGPHPSAAANVRFWETAGQNRGMNVKLFKDRSEALVWLLA